MILKDSSTMRISVFRKQYFSSLIVFCCFLFVILISCNKTFAQSKATIYGKIIDNQIHEGIEFVSVSVVGLPGATQTDKDGK